MLELYHDRCGWDQTIKLLDNDGLDRRRAKALFYDLDQITRRRGDTVMNASLHTQLTV